MDESLRATLPFTAQKGPSRAEWVAAAVVILAASNGTFDVLANNGPKGWSEGRLAFGYLANFLSVALLAVRVHNVGWKQLVRLHWVFMLLVGWLVLACTWSVSPAHSMRWVAANLGFFCAWIAIASWPRVVDQLAVVIAGFAVGFAVSFLSEHTQRPLFDPNAGAMGIWGHRNFLGHAIGVAVVAALCLLRQSPRRYVLLSVPTIVAAGYWLQQSRSKTPVIAIGVAVVSWMAVVALAALLRSTYATPNVLKGLTLGSGLVAVVAVAVTRHRLAKITITERVPMWRALWPHVRESWVTGFGPGQVFFNATNRPEAIFYAIRKVVPHPHNGFLDAQIDGGIVLLALLLVLVALAGTSIIRLLPTNRYLAADLGAILALCVVQNVTEPDFFQSMRPTLLLVLVVGAVRFDRAATPANPGSEVRVSENIRVA